MTGENTDKLRMAAENGIQFELKGSQGKLIEYLHVLDIVGSHQKSKIFL